MLTASRIWVPESHADKQLVSLNRAVREYDERLMFGRNEDNGQWAVFMKMPHGEAPIPVLGFGHEIPSVDDMMRKLWKADTRRHSDSILEAMNEHNRRIRAELDEKASEGEDHFVEGWESFLHRRGDTPYHRSLRKRDPKQRFFEKG